MLWQDLRAHRSTAVLFGLAILVLWALVLATWVFDDSGQTVGMHPVGLTATAVLPVVAGALVVRWEDGLRRGRTLLSAGLAGLFAAEAGFLGSVVLWLVVYHWLLGKTLIESGSMLDAFAEALGFIVVVAIVGWVLGSVGGAVFAAARAVLRC